MRAPALGSTKIFVAPASRRLSGGHPARPGARCPRATKASDATVRSIARDWSREAAQRIKPTAQAVGTRQPKWNSPETHEPWDGHGLSPHRGSVRFGLQPTACAVGYILDAASRLAESRLRSGRAGRQDADATKPQRLFRSERPNSRSAASFRRYHTQSPSFFASTTPALVKIAI
jgi:hypothetical protein